MDQASQLFVQPDLERQDARQAFPAPRMVLHFAVTPGATLTWRAPNHAEIRTHDALVWLTRSHNAGDYWMKPGEMIRVQRGERVWISTDSPQSAEISITTRYTPVRPGWFARCRTWFARRF
jgi:hypothetical protein